MNRRRIFHEAPLRCGDSVTLDAAAGHHLAKVLRCRTGEQLELFNGDGCGYLATIHAITRRETRVGVTAQSPPEAAPRLAIHLGLPLSKGQRMDFAVQKAVELGVAAITPLLSAHAAVKLPPQRLQHKQQHWRQVVISACEQSGRNRLPLLHAPMALDDWPAAEVGSGILLDPLAEHTLASLDAPAASTTLYLVCGPEGGFSRAEIERLRQRRFAAVRLGPRVLRSETAPLAAIAALQTLWGDFR
jgi:16S rRNA (uracil1498-N3)-methyltransferase